MSFKGRGTALLGAAAALAAMGALLIANAAAQVVRSGDLIMEIEGSISPSKLPKKAPAPIALNLEGSLKSASGRQNGLAY